VILLGFFYLSLGNRFITFTQNENKEGPFLDVNGVVYPQLQLARLESYMILLNPPTLVICLETLGGNPYNDGLLTPCFEETSMMESPS